MMKFKLSFILFTVLCSLFSQNAVLGQHFESDSYIIDWGNFNITSGRKTSTNYRLTDTVGQNAPGRFTNDGYLVKAGFQYIYDLTSPFSFTISDLSIDFGTLTPNIGTTQTNILTITSPSGHGYQITASENHPLWIDSSSQISDTTCDANDCSETASGLWTSNSTFGFGFNAIGINSSNVATGVGTSDYFANSSYFRQFADTSNNEIPQIIMAENSPVKDHRARVSYKVNIDNLQASGSYQNAITFVAVPKY